MAKKRIYRPNDLFGIGIFAYPVLEFNERMETAKETTPQMDEQARAARVYFGMLAEQPKPTREDECVYFDYENSNREIKDWLKYEEYFKYKALPVAMPLKNADAQTAYFSSLKNLQTWLSYYGLMDGIKKTLAEESRKKQAELASIQASKAAAAKALAYSRMNEDLSEEARREAAENEARAQKTLDENLTKEAELKQELENIKAGYLVEQTGGSVWPWLLLGAGAFFALGKNKGKRSK
jgi:hypothetical protein